MRAKAPSVRLHNRSTKHGGNLFGCCLSLILFHPINRSTNRSTKHGWATSEDRRDEQGPAQGKWTQDMGRIEAISDGPASSFSRWRCAAHGWGHGGGSGAAGAGIPGGSVQERIDDGHQEAASSDQEFPVQSIRPGGRCRSTPIDSALDRIPAPCSWPCGRFPLVRVWCTSTTLTTTVVRRWARGCVCAAWTASDTVSPT